MKTAAEFTHVSTPVMPLWSISFRPFFAVGAVFSAGLILLWLLVFTHVLPLSLNALWHAHEMLYGFGTAIMAGFLLTAIQNWTKMRGLHGLKLQILVGVWVIGRFGLFLPWPILSAVLDLAFIFCFAYFLHPYLSQKGQGKNRVFYVFLSLLLIGNLMYHLEILGITSGTARKGIYLALNLFMLMIMLISGRVIPAFTRNALDQAKLNKWPWVEKSIYVLAGLWLIAEFFQPQLKWTGYLAIALGLINAVRFCGWHPWQTIKKPILLVLPLGYAWLIAALICRGFLGVTPALTHMFTMGAMGGLMHAMMTRVALGHTGRNIIASKAVVLAYILLQLAVVLRALIPQIYMAWYMPAIIASGILWVLIFVLYLWEFVPFLFQPRPDGKES